MPAIILEMGSQCRMHEYIQLVYHIYCMNVDQCVTLLGTKLKICWNFFVDPIYMLSVLSGKSHVMGIVVYMFSS